MKEFVLNYITVKIGLYPFIFGVIMAFKVIGISFIPHLDIVTYALYLISSLYLLKQGASFDMLTLILILYIPLSIIIDQPPDVFQPWQRYILFIFLLFCVSPLLVSEKAMAFRMGLMRITLILCVFIAVISFFGYFVGLNMMRNTYSGMAMDYMANKAGTFGGITSHSMLLGPISGIAVIVCSCKAMVDEDRRRFWIMLALASCGSMLFAASRSSLIATIGGEICLLWFYSRKRGKMMKRVIVALLLGLVAFPVWESSLDGINAKNTGDIKIGINTGSRDEKWQYRIEEWKDSPVTGIGFSAVSDRDEYSFGGKIEPGSSWLAILSMTGALGFGLFAILFGRALKNSLLTLTPNGALIGGVLVMLGIHMIAEGHVFSGGSYLCFCVWLFMGCATDYDANSEESEQDII